MFTLVKKVILVILIILFITSNIGSSSLAGIVVSFTVMGTEYDVVDCGLSKINNIPPFLDAPIRENHSEDVHNICNACSAVFHVIDQEYEYIMKCNNCGEAIPMEEAPCDYQYVRCPSKHLSVCLITTPEFDCPRPKCQYRLRVVSRKFTYVDKEYPIISKIICIHCKKRFEQPKQLQNTMVKCRYCKKFSTVEPQILRLWAYRLLCIAIGTFLIGLNIAILNIVYDYHEIFQWKITVICLVTALIAFWRSRDYLSTKVSGGYNYSEDLEKKKNEPKPKSKSKKSVDDSENSSSDSDSAAKYPRFAMINFIPSTLSGHFKHEYEYMHI